MTRVDLVEGELVAGLGQPAMGPRQPTTPIDRPSPSPVGPQ
jgi:hypothetical protein